MIFQKSMEKKTPFRECWPLPHAHAHLISSCLAVYFIYLFVCVQCISVIARAYIYICIYLCWRLLIISVNAVYSIVWLGFLYVQAFNCTRMRVNQGRSFVAIRLLDQPVHNCCFIFLQVVGLHSWHYVSPWDVPFPYINTFLFIYLYNMQSILYNWLNLFLSIMYIYDEFILVYICRLKLNKFIILYLNV